MSETELTDTQPNPVKGDTSPNVAIPARKIFPRWLIALFFVLLIAIGGLGGYGSGMYRRTSAQNTRDSGQMQEQLLLGVQAMQAGNYEVAKLHFEFIIQRNPNYPGVQAAYAELFLRIQSTPTFTPSPTATPTADLRNTEEKFSHALEMLNASNWDEAIGDLDSLRKTAPTYRTAEVDGMYYIALHERGIGKILAPTCDEINLEGGIYDLTLAERFGPLDGAADGLRTYPRLYITGASFWDQDWVQVQNYFFQVKSAFPSLTDSSCENATERWRYATIKYAEQLLAAGDFCAAEEQFNSAFSVGSSLNEPYFPTATDVTNQCNGGDDNGGGGGEPISTPTADGTPTETPTPGEVPSETPTTG